MAQVRNLQPQGLDLEPAERRLMPLLAPLLPTPRAAKKLLNLYRLVRVSVPDPDLGNFVSEGTYQVVLVLLALLVGHPESARSVLEELRTTTAGDFFQLLGELQGRAQAGESTGGAKRDWDDLVEAVSRVRKKAVGDVVAEVEPYRRWAGTIAQFSFHTRDLLTEAPAGEPRPGGR